MSVKNEETFKRWLKKTCEVAGLGKCDRKLLLREKQEEVIALWERHDRYYTHEVENKLLDLWISLIGREARPEPIDESDKSLAKCFAENSETNSQTNFENSQKDFQTVLQFSALSVWQQRWLRLAQHVAAWSKDPSTQVGAVIAKDSQFISMGFNGFPQGIADDGRLEQPEIKHKIVIHAEENALAFAQQTVREATLFVSPLHPCPRCASKIIQAEISEVIFLSPQEKHREAYDYKFVMSLFGEAGISAVEVLQEPAPQDESAYFLSK